ncbi:hypothetical protein D1007_30729 [Hordeum vulgare]|uniref:Uncharacterized protein n=1 Tax=Hordeum vulgare subsp. vulgare TaxID=112509 RepID=A0A8I6XKT0_HORVV|nr:uncharacterized protein LOC123439566 [Hordeum vulgare subsp. vulgare]KAE8794426.1 hypothetical protein D1007_30729 [Hordeum vulgare]KAI5005562.1 hypothetical protein ZWY2020_032805 [Hordeum vulgare]
MAGKDVVPTATTQRKSVARRLWRVVRAVLYMLRRGVLPSGSKLAMDLGLLLRRGKKAGKVLGGLSSARSSSFSCRALDPALAVHEPSRSRREVEFSCSNTPFSAAAKGRHHRNDNDDDPGYYYSYDAADIAKVFEMLNEGGHPFDDDAVVMAAATATPSPAPWYSSASGSGARPNPGTRQLRIADSPFSAPGNETPGEQQVDRKADEFIRRFYEQLRAQKSVAATPENDGYAAGSYTGRSPRPVVAAGIV